MEHRQLKPPDGGIRKERRYWAMMTKNEERIVRIVLIILAVAMVLIAVDTIILIATYGFIPVDIVGIIAFVTVGAAVVFLLMLGKKNKDEKK